MTAVQYIADLAIYIGFKLCRVECGKWADRA